MNLSLKVIQDEVAGVGVNNEHCMPFAVLLSRYGDKEVAERQPLTVENTALQQRVVLAVALHVLSRVRPDLILAVRFYILHRDYSPVHVFVDAHQKCPDFFVDMERLGVWGLCIAVRIMDCLFAKIIPTDRYRDRMVVAWYRTPFACTCRRRTEA